MALTYPQPLTPGDWARTKNGDLVRLVRLCNDANPFGLSPYWLARCAPHGGLDALWENTLVPAKPTAEEEAAWLIAILEN